MKQGTSGSKSTKSSSHLGKTTVQQTKATKGVAGIQRPSTSSKASKTLKATTKPIAKKFAAAKAAKQVGKTGAFAVATRHNPTPRTKPLPKESKD
ncbi:MAG: hypothetical protein ABFD13_03700 [Candidatus Cryosericum sp.]|nr:hypothetical protein [bacterium]